MSSRRSVWRAPIRMMWAAWPVSSCTALEPVFRRIFSARARNSARGYWIPVVMTISLGSRQQALPRSDTSLAPVMHLLPPNHPSRYDDHINRPSRVSRAWIGYTSGAHSFLWALVLPTSACHEQVNRLMGSGGASFLSTIGPHVAFIGMWALCSQSLGSNPGILAPMMWVLLQRLHGQSRMQKEDCMAKAECRKKKHQVRPRQPPIRELILTSSSADWTWLPPAPLPKLKWTPPKGLSQVKS